MVWNKVSFSYILTQKVTESLKVVNSYNILCASMPNVYIEKVRFCKSGHKYGTE